MKHAILNEVRARMALLPPFTPREAQAFLCREFGLELAEAQIVFGLLVILGHIEELPTCRYCARVPADWN